MSLGGDARLYRAFAFTRLSGLSAPERGEDLLAALLETGHQAARAGEVLDGEPRIQGV